MIREKYGFKKVLDNSSFDNDYCIEIGCSDSEQMKKVIDIVAGNTYKDILDYMGNHSLSFDKVILEMKE